MINVSFDRNIMTISDQDRNDDIIVDLKDIVSIKRYGKSKIILPPLGISGECRKVDTTTKLHITLINKEDITLESGIFDREDMDKWETTIEEIYKTVVAHWKKYKVIK